MRCHLKPLLGRIIRCRIRAKVADLQLGKVPDKVLKRYPTQRTTHARVKRYSYTYKHYFIVINTAQVESLWRPGQTFVLPPLLARGSS